MKDSTGYGPERIILILLPLIKKAIPSIQKFASKLGSKTKTLLNNIVNRSNPLIKVGSKSEALNSINKLPTSIQGNVKSFFKGGSNKYTDFVVEKMSNGNYLAKMTKPGDVPGSKAIYYKEISSTGETINVYKKTFDPLGNLIHTKQK